MPLSPSDAFSKAFRDVKQKMFSRFSTPSHTRYVVDPLDGTMWDLKPVLGRMLELMGQDISSEGPATTSDALTARVRGLGIEPEIVIFKSRKMRPLGLRHESGSLEQVDWSEVEIENPPMDRDANYCFVLVKRYARDPKVVAAALKASNGRCQACKEEGPFINSDGKPFLEVHHIDPLAGGGADNLSNVAALCPNCHRKQHYGVPDKLVANL